jgi:hypothetical protein
MSSGPYNLNSVNNKRAIAKSINSRESFENIENGEKHKCFSWPTKIFYSFGHIYNGK